MTMKSALILTEGDLCNIHAKTAHGLIRSSSRFRIVGIVARAQAGRPIADVVEKASGDIPIFADMAEALDRLPDRPDFGVVGIATHGGKLTETVRVLLAECLDAGMGVVNGLHEYASDDPQLAAKAEQQGLAIIDVRKPPPKNALHFWTGRIAEAAAPRLAVLGTDCALGKRTTARLLADTCGERGINVEMIYTGQSGWMQGADFGFVLDSVPNDFVSGELEHAILSCDEARKPDLMVIEGQSSLRNPCGPCGSELLLSGQCRGAILQHAPGRQYFEGYEDQKLALPDVADEIRLIAMYGAETVAVTLNTSGLSGAEAASARQALERELCIPVFNPLETPEALVDVAQQYMAAEKARSQG